MIIKGGMHIDQFAPIKVLNMGAGVAVDVSSWRGFRTPASVTGNISFNFSKGSTVSEACKIGGQSTGDTTISDPNVTNVAAIAEYRVGMTVTGTGIPASTTIVSINTAGNSFVMSNNATATGSGVTITGLDTKVIATTPARWVIGATITGTGIPASTTITAIDSTTKIMTLSAATTAYGAAVTCYSNALINVVNTGSWAVGDPITGTGIPASTTVSAVKDNQKVLFLDKQVTANGDNIELWVDKVAVLQGSTIYWISNVVRYIKLSVAQDVEVEM